MESAALIIIVTSLAISIISGIYAYKIIRYIRSLHTLISTFSGAIICIIARRLVTLHLSVNSDSTLEFINYAVLPLLISTFLCIFIYQLYKIFTKHFAKSL